MISATLCAIIFPAPVVQVLPLERRSDRTSVFETGLTRARHEPAIGATKSTRLVGLRRSLARDWSWPNLEGWPRSSLDVRRYARRSWHNSIVRADHHRHRVEVIIHAQLDDVQVLPDSRKLFSEV